MPHDFHKALFNPVYLKAAKDFNRVRVEQIRYGASKYSEPLNYKSWTPEEMVQHARQELVDLNHYLTCMDMMMEDMLEDIHWLCDAVEATNAFVDDTRWHEILLKYRGPE